MRKLIVDGYNLTDCYPPLAAMAKLDRPQAGKELVPILKTYASKHPTVEVTVVFDAEYDSVQRGIGKGNLRIVYASRAEWGDQPADEYIRKMVEPDPKPQECQVISSDGEVARYVRTCGAESLSSEQFSCTLLKLVRPHPESSVVEPSVEGRTWDDEKREAVPLKQRRRRAPASAQQCFKPVGSLSTDTTVEPGAILIRWSDLLSSECTLDVFANKRPDVRSVHRQGSIGRSGECVLSNMAAGCYDVVIHGEGGVYLHLEVRLP